MDRRNFIGLVGLATSLSFGRSWAADQNPATSILSRAIPRSGEKLPVIGMGTSGSFEVGDSPAEREPLIEVTRLLLQTENSVIDTAPSYGSAERVTGDILRQLDARKRAFIATKISAPSGEAAREQWRNSLARLQTERIDLLQVHNLVDWERNLAFLQELKQAGKVRYVGVTHYLESAHEALIQVLESKSAKDVVDFVQVNYSVSTRGAEKRLLPLCRERGVAVMINRAFDDGNLFQRVKGKPVPEWAREIECETWGQLFLKFVLGHPAVTCIIPATSKPKNMLDNLRAGVGTLPDAQYRERIARLIA